MIRGLSELGFIRVTMVWRRELGVLAVNWTDILDGEIVNAAWAVAGMVARLRTARKVAGLDTAAWADTERLIRDALAGLAADPVLPELSEDEATELAAAVRGPEVQGALQALLAVRLTDAPESDAARAREAVRLALDRFSGQPLMRQADPGPGSGGPPDRRRPGLRGLAPVGSGIAARHAGPLSEYFDEKISALVATLEGRAGFATLAQVRNEAYNARIVALLGAIERQVTALASPGGDWGRLHGSTAAPVPEAAAGSDQKETSRPASPGGTRISVPRLGRTAGQLHRGRGRELRRCQAKHAPVRYDLDFRPYSIGR
jgi:hypothetical protein